MVRLDIGALHEDDIDPTSRAPLSKARTHCLSPPVVVTHDQDLSKFVCGKLFCELISLQTDPK